MLMHKKGRFYINGLSFALPDDVCVLTRETPYNNLNGFVLTGLDQRVQVIIDTEDDIENPEEYFKTDGFTKHMHILSEIKTYENNGIKGAYVFCETKSEQYCEMRLKLPVPNDEATILSVCVLVQKGSLSIEQAVEAPFIKEFLSSIKKDK